MLDGFQRVLEVGCADAFGTRLVQQAVGHVTAIDFDPIFIDDARRRDNPHWPLELFVHDMLSAHHLANTMPFFSLDVLEHIQTSQEKVFISNDGALKAPVLIVGMPSLESQAYASPQSKAGHVNCKTGAEFKALFTKYFHSVFLFSMNDEVVHTGFTPMAHYIIVICCGKKDS